MFGLVCRRTSMVRFDIKMNGFEDQKVRNSYAIHRVISSIQFSIFPARAGVHDQLVTWIYVSLSRFSRESESFELAWRSRNVAQYSKNTA